MTRLAFAAALLLLSACSSGPSGREDAPGRIGRFAAIANPSAVIARELAFDRAARELGQWTAFRDFAAEGAVMFVPEQVDARAWLANRSDPAETVRWQPHRVWMSCDGSLAATLGAWQRPDGTTGYFTTVWERQEKGGYAWVMDQGDTLDAPLEAPEMIAGDTASCDLPPAAAPGSTAMPAVVAGAPSRASRDGTLRWSVDVAADCGRTVTVGLWKGPEQGVVEVLRRFVAAPASEAGKPGSALRGMIELFISAFATLFVVIDPIGVAPIYGGLTSGASPAEARAMALRATVIATVILFVFAVVGEQLLHALGIELDSFRIAGGIMLFLIALEMVFEKRTERREQRAEKILADPPVEDVSVFPVAIPMIAGPGSIATVMLLMARAQGPAQSFAVLAALGVILLLTAVALVAAQPIMRLLGSRAEAVITRLLGVILAALAAQYVIGGLRSAFDLT